MRIIAGEFRGRPLKAPPGKGTRPMLGRVREALFSTLGTDLDELWVLDLFAGTGSLGLEALSRGATHARMIEADHRVLRILKENVEQLGVEERCEPRRGDALDPRGWEPPPEATGEGWCAIFLDPPYPFLADERRAGVFEAIEGLVARLTPGGVLVFHAPRRAVSEQDFPAGIAARERTYGTTSLWYLTPGGGQANEQAEAPEG